MISRWQDLWLPKIQEKLEVFGPNEDLTWEAMINFQTVAPGAPPQPCVTLVVFTKNPVLGAGDLIAFGGWPLSMLTDQMLDAALPQLIEGLRSARAAALAQDGQVDFRTEVKTQAGLVVPGT